MTHLIDKDALIAEIGKRLYEYSSLKLYDACTEARASELGKLLIILNTLEVKEVDLEKIINDYFKDWKFDEELDIMVKPNNYSATFDDIKEVAKHFFELGLSVSNKAQKGE
jgi:hypothetical protein